MAKVNRNWELTGSRALEKEKRLGQKYYPEQTQEKG